MAESGVLRFVSQQKSPENKFVGVVLPGRVVKHLYDNKFLSDNSVSKKLHLRTIHVHYSSTMFGKCTLKSAVS